MDHDTYLAGVAELYTAEVLGEGLASRWLELTSVPDPPIQARIVSAARIRGKSAHPSASRETRT